MKARFFLLPLTLVPAVFAADTPEISDQTLLAYSAMHKMTDQPRSISTQFSTLCGTNPESAASRKRTGPHYAHWINVFMNDDAKTHFESPQKTTGAFPPGSIVIKEKLYPGSSAVHLTTEMGAVAGMIKHSPGYAPETGDWEFFFAYKGQKMERGTKGKLASCADCHHNAPHDYVYGDFARSTTSP